MDTHKRERLIELSRHWLDFAASHPHLDLPEINTAPLFNGLRLLAHVDVRTPHELLGWLDALNAGPDLTVSVERRTSDRVLRVHQLVPDHDELQVTLTAYASRWDAAADAAGTSDARHVDTVTAYLPTGRRQRPGTHGSTTVGQLRAAFSTEPAPAVTA